MSAKRGTAASPGPQGPLTFLQRFMGDPRVRTYVLGPLGQVSINKSRGRGEVRLGSLAAAER